MVTITVTIKVEGNNENNIKKDAPTRDRTEDLSVNSRTLYQLSHGGTAEEETSESFTKK